MEFLMVATEKSLPGESEEDARREKGRHAPEITKACLRNVLRLLPDTMGLLCA
jgi:hypothetical protein